jgi:IgGFc binding protein
MPRARGLLAWCVATFFAFSGACGSGADAPPGDATGGAGTGNGGTGASDGAAATGGTGNIDLDAATQTCPRCSDDLHSIIDCQGNVKQTCLADNGCDIQTVTCINACAAAEGAKRSIGCEYYAVFMDQLNPDSCFAVFVANTWDTSAHLTVERDGVDMPVENFTYLTQGQGPALTYVALGANGLSPGKVAIMFLAGPDGTPAQDNPVCPKPSAVPNGAMLFNKSGIGKAFKITSDVPVVAYQINPYGGGYAAVTGSSLLLPASAWDTNYVAFHAYNAGPQATSMNIVAREKTNVTMVPTAQLVGGQGLPPGSPGGTYEFSLDAGQYAQFTQLDELTGSVIQSDKPVGFFAGGRCSQIPYNVYACDHVEQQLPPVQALGDKYVGVSYSPRSGEPALWRVMGVVDGTELTWSSDIGGPATVDRGQVIEFSTYFPFQVRSQDSDHPYLLMALMSGGDTNNMNGIGDAETVLSVPPAQYLSSYLFFTDPTYPVTNLVVVRAPDKGTFSDVELDCAGVLTGWKGVGDYEYTRLNLTQGDFENVGKCSTGPHTIKSDGKFGLWIWGWGGPYTSLFTSYVSYGYPGGMNLQHINQVVVPIPK